MAKSLASLRFCWVVLATASIALATACSLPDDRYLRYQTLTDKEVVKSGWIYERIHYDPTPIDVVFIGSSHTVFGIDSEKVERVCREAGGERCASINLGLQHLGRNMQWLVAREVMQTRKPRLLVVEVQETESRALHPAFAFLADASDVISAPLVVNTSFFPDLAGLPRRQISAFAQSLAPSLFGEHREFLPSLYRGAHWDDVFAEKGSSAHPIAHPAARVGAASVAELDRERGHLESEDRSRLRLPGPLQPLEYRANLLYLENLLTLAREKNVEIRFLYMPSYHDAQAPAFASFYAGFAPTWDMPREIADDHDLWLDVGHLNYAGATALSVWLGAQISKSTSVPKPDGSAAHS